MSATIYSINPTDKRDQFDVTQVAEVTLAGAYSTMGVFEVAGKLLLFGYDKTSHKTDTYDLTAQDPWVAPVENQLELKGPWDAVEPFVIGDKPHLMCYQAKDGEFAFVPVTDEIKSLYPRYFRHSRVPYTTDLTMVKPLASLGQVFVMGYNGANGYVNFWTVSVTATSDGKHPPLDVENAWAHQWAKGWTRFAFFTWGGENFFLKTNTWKPNVNIDHVSSVLSAGTNEVGSYLKLKDDQKLNIVHPFMVGAGDPYFLTYLADTGETTFNRVHGDCKGWTTVADLKTVTGATQIVPYRIGETNYALFV